MTPPKKETTLDGAAIIQALKEHSKRIEKIADVVQKTVDTTQKTAIGLADVQATMRALKDSLDKITVAVNASNRLKERVATLEAEHVNMARSLQDAKIGCNKRWWWVLGLLGAGAIAAISVLITILSTAARAIK